MSDVIDWSNSEPPNRYVLAYGTQHCLIEQDYDHTIYGECEYIASRTLIKCKSVRKKADLKANGGICEMHTRFHEAIRDRFLCEERRLAQDSGPGKQKYAPFTNQDGFICDEFPWLMPSHRWESPLPRTIYDYAPDDDPVAPLRHAGVYTDRDILKMRRALTEKKIKYLQLHGEMMMERARRRANELLTKNRKEITLGENNAAVVAACASIDDYGCILRRMTSSQKYRSGEWKKVEPPRCSFGTTLKNSLSKEDRDSISCVLNAILDCVGEDKMDFVSYMKAHDARAPDIIEINKEEVKQCTAPAIPHSEYCISHQMLDERQIMFVPCSVCHSMCSGLSSPPMCGKHLVEFAKNKRAAAKDARVPVSSLINLSSGVPPLSPLSKLKSVNDPSKPLFGLPSNSVPSPFVAGSSVEKRSTKRVSIDSYTKEDSDSVLKRFRSEVPPQMTVGEALTQSSAVTDAIRRAEMRRSREDEVCSCARIRPFNRSNFPPKTSVPRRVTAVVRPPIPVRRQSIVEGNPMRSQSPQVPQSDSGNRLAGGSDQVAPRQLPVPLPRRFQQPHRFVPRDSRLASPQSFISTRPQYSSSSPSTSTIVLDEAGNEVLMEERRSPLRNQQAYDGGANRVVIPTQTRPYISSYRRHPQTIIRQQPGVQYVRDGTSHQEVPRTHATLPPPPDPPLLPFSHGYVRPIPLERRPPNTEDNDRKAGGRVEPTPSGASSQREGDVPPARDVQPVAESTEKSERLLDPPPPPPILRPRFPTILRKVDGVAIPAAPTAAQHPPAPSVAQRPPPPGPLPRPPPASRPMPPHRLLSAAARPVPPHRLIKSLPLPVVPAPRAPKLDPKTESANAPEHSKAPDNLQDTVPAERLTTSSDAPSAPPKPFVDKANGLSSADLDPLRILADVSEAARDSVASSSGAKPAAAASTSTQQPSAPQPPTNMASNGDDDDDFEEEL
ncbi:hypothetical protein V3C99_002489 [Haemonchus contortus]